MLFVGNSFTNTENLDRLPTVSASEALRDLKAANSSRLIPTGLKQLDLILQGRPTDVDDGARFRGGLMRGQVSEVYGPPGVGKTTFGYAGGGGFGAECAGVSDDAIV